MGDQAKRLVKDELRNDQSLVSTEKKTVRDEEIKCRNRNTANKQKRGEYARNKHFVERILRQTANKILNQQQLQMNVIKHDYVRRMIFNKTSIQFICY